MYLASAVVVGAPECVCESGCSYSRGGGWLRPFISDFIQHQQSQTHSLDSKLDMSMFVGQNVLF